MFLATKNGDFAEGRAVLPARCPNHSMAPRMKYSQSGTIVRNGGERWRRVEILSLTEKESTVGKINRPFSK